MASSLDNAASTRRHSEPPPHHAVRGGPSQVILAPPLFLSADSPEPTSSPDGDIRTPGFASPGEVPERKPQIKFEQPGSSHVERDRELGSLDVTMGQDGSDDEIEYLGTSAGSTRVPLHPEVRPPQLGNPVGLPIDTEHHSRDDSAPKRPAPDPDDDDYFEMMDQPGTPLNEVNEEERSNGGVCRACGCDCRVAERSKDEETPRSRGRGSGSQTLSHKILGNILGLLLGTDSLLKRLQAKNHKFQRWEHVSVEVGARAADFDRVRHASRWMQRELPDMKRRGKF